MIIDHGKVVYAEKEPGRDVTVSQHLVVPSIVPPFWLFDVRSTSALPGGVFHIRGMGRTLTVSPSDMSFCQNALLTHPAWEQVSGALAVLAKL